MADKLPTGVGVDSSGHQAIDPTTNVRALVEADVKRLDDLSELRATYTEKLVRLEITRIEDILKLRAEYDNKLSVAESKRIDAIREVDVNERAIAAERTTQQATVLATELAESREILRTLIANNAITATTQLNSATTPLSDRLAALERSSYTGAGKQQFTDPMMFGLVTDTQNLRRRSDIGVGTSKGASMMWAYVIAGVMAFLGMASLIVTVVHVLTAK
jgi:hypothetical protein